MTGRSIVALVLVLGSGYFPARLVTRSNVAAATFAPLGAALLWSVAATLTVAVRAPFAFAVGLVAAATVGAVVAGAATGGRLGTSQSADSVRAAGCLPLGGLIPLLALRRPPTSYDANVIWWLHAKWFIAGGDAAARAMGDSLYLFAQPGYPPLAPATVAGSWWVAGTDDPRLAQWVTALLTLSAACLFAFVILRAANRAVGRLAPLIGIGVVLGTYAVVAASPDSPGTNGYVDVLWSAAFAAAAIALLVKDPDGVSLRVGTFALAVAAVTKNDGLLAVILLVGLLAVAWRKTPRRLVWPAAALAPAVLWAVVARALGAKSVLVDSARLGALLRLDPDVLDRFGPTLRAQWHEGALLILVAAITTTLGVVSARRARADLELAAPSHGLWAAWLLTTASVTLAFVVSPFEIHGHLGAAADRTAFAGNLLLLGETVLWGLAGALHLRRLAGSRAAEGARHQPTGDYQVPATGLSLDQP